MNEMMERCPSILLIDDEKEKLDGLKGRVAGELRDATVEGWYPGAEAEEPGGFDPVQEFDRRIGKNTILVVTDLDLTKATKGFLGHSVVAWCRRRFIPVGDFSRRMDALPKEPDLFQLRVPRDEDAAVACIARMFRGFRRMASGIERKSAVVRKCRNPAEVLGAVLGRQDLESQLAPYLSKPGLFNASLLEALPHVHDAGGDTTEAKKNELLTYILGHFLVNAVFKYPGPILSAGPFCAYLGASKDDLKDLARLFTDARYKGPFDDGVELFWRSVVDDKIESLSGELDVVDSKFESFGDYHRAVIEAVIERKLGRAAGRHGCKRCEGVKGGFWCPFTERAVCERSDCSSTASSWVPSGAYACRVERDFFEEWSPILGF